MQTTSSKKTIVIIVIVFVIAGLLYFYFSGSPQDSSISSLSSDEVNVDADVQLATSARILSLLNQVNSIHIDTAFFESSVYKSLIDRAVVVPEQNVGRNNPFVPVSGTFIESVTTNPTPSR